jgi:integrase
MASVHRDPRRRSPFWYAAFTLSDGRRTFRSTKQRARNLALGIALKWENAAVRGRRGQLNEAQARKVLNDILESAGQGPMNLQSVEQFFGTWLASKEVSKAKATARRYKDVVRPFLEQLPLQKRRGALSGVAPADVQSFRDSHLQAGLANKTANFSLKTLRNVFNAARRQGLILTNPAEAVEALPDNSTERGVFTLDELRALLRESNEEWRGVILLGYSAGLRLGDAARLRWSEVELAEPVPVLRFYPQKTSGSGAKRRPLEIPILPDLEKYLQQLPVRSRNPEAPLFPGLARKKVGGRTGLSNTFTRLIAASGINNPVLSKGKGAKGRAVYRLSFHSLRHTFISTMANVGISKEMRMKLAGHTSAAHDRYTHVEIQTLRGALKSFPSLAPENRQ